MGDKSNWRHWRPEPGESADAFEARVRAAADAERAEHEPRAEEKLARMYEDRARLEAEAEALRQRDSCVDALGFIPVETGGDQVAFVNPAKVAVVRRYGADKGELVLDGGISVVAKNMTVQELSRAVWFALNAGKLSPEKKLEAALTRQHEERAKK